jgi:hypothetical protein
MERHRNIAQAIAAGIGCPVWTPLVPITNVLASKLDAALAEALTKGTAISLDEFFAAQGKSEAYAHVYTRYGV